MEKKIVSYSMAELVVLTRNMLNEYTGSCLSDISLNQSLRENQEEHRRFISNCIRTCCSGNYGAKETVKEIIKSYLKDDLALDESTIHRIIAFGTPEKLSSWELMEVMIYDMERKYECNGFAKLYELNGWGKEEDKQGYVVSEKDIREAYNKMHPKLTLNDQLNVLTQLIFARTVGLGVIDTLNQQKGCIEEIQLGMNGRTERYYDYKEDLSGKQKTEFFSRDGVHILVKGNTIWLPFLSFETDEELQRVLRNLIKDSQAGELTKNNPMIVVDTIDGRRVSVSRPPMTDVWVGLIRKFDTVTEVSLESLYRGHAEGDLLIGLLRQIVRCGRNIAITGEMASGKTTLFRACLAEARKDLNIRVVEVDSFELNVRSFLPKANSMTMRVTDGTPAEDVLAFARKTTGQIFAVGEINSASVAAMAMDLSKIASQLFFSAHYVSTEHMIADLVNAKLCVGGYSEEKLAEMDVVRCLGYDIHLRTHLGKRYVQYITEVIPVAGNGKNDRMFQIRLIYEYEEESKQGILHNRPSKLSYESAKQNLSEKEYLEFCNFFAEVNQEEPGEA